MYPHEARRRGPDGGAGLVPTPPRLSWGLKAGLGSHAWASL